MGVDIGAMMTLAIMSLLRNPSLISGCSEERPEKKKRMGRGMVENKGGLRSC